MIDTLVSALGVISVAVWIIVILRLYFTSVPEENKPRKIEHDECPICIEVYDNETLLTCGHAFCGRCILDYLSRFSSNATCPLCRNNITKLFVNFEANNDESREMEQKVERFNVLNGSAPRSMVQLIIDVPFLIFRILTDKELMKVIFWSGRFISLILFGFAYLFTPNDLIPDEDNGIFGWIDDLGVIFIILIIMGIVVYNKMTQLSAMRVHA